jgi:hypothetical protein
MQIIKKIELYALGQSPNEHISESRHKGRVQIMLVVVGCPVLLPLICF